MRQAVLEVVRYDPIARHIYVGSAMGFRAEWFLNLLKHPEAEVDFRGRRWRVYARVLTRDHSRCELLTYEKSHPVLSRFLRFLLGEGIWEQVCVVRLEIPPYTE